MKLGSDWMALSSYEMNQCVGKASCGARGGCANHRIFSVSAWFGESRGFWTRM